MPSRINTAMVAEYKKKLGASPDFVAVDTKGLSVLQFTELRKLAREKGVQVLVVKTSLAVIALKDAAPPELEDKAEQALTVAMAGKVAIVGGGGGLPSVERLIAGCGKKTGKLAVRGRLFEKPVLLPAQVATFCVMPDG